jgi:ferritin-like metal-binding protein YciE
MTARSIEEQLTKYLADAHSIEVQALAQLERAPDIAREEGLEAAFRAHHAETQMHEQLIRQRLRQRGADPSRLKDIAGRVGGVAMIAFARVNPDTPGKLLAHAFAYEHMELAAYELLARVAERAGEHEVVENANLIAEQERAMARRLAESYDGAVEASLRQKQAKDLNAELVSYLRNVRALEAQAIQLLKAGRRLVGCEGLADALRSHLDQTREHHHLIEERLHAHSARPSLLQEGALSFGALNMGAFLGAQPDTAVKLAGFAFAFEHLEIAAYELLRRIAERAGDSRTAAVAERILPEEHEAAGRIAACWDEAVEAAIDAIGVKLAPASA